MKERVKSKAREKQARGPVTSELDEALMETFPASDPPAATQHGMKVGTPNHKKATAAEKNH
jgi:hypothetical protein